MGHIAAEPARTVENLATYRVRKSPHLLHGLV